MRYREFDQLVEEVLGRVQGRVLVTTLHLGSLEDRTAEQALADGEEPAHVWHALADELQIDEAHRWGVGAARNTPPRRRA
ncbi:MAG: DUF3046 domain-containing protein [Actinobacteria bacterium]|nr:DUF3046 domain-containing protein [Actinomycetota bacterium]MCG2802444.1 DUF3046 domain-containing protein [Cellulomonas sp.]